MTDNDMDDEFDPTPRFVLLEVRHESESHSFQEDSWDDALTEEQMLEMLAQKLGYELTKRGA